MNPLKWKLHWQILAALAIAAFIGAVFQISGARESGAAESLSGIASFVGKDLFMNLLKMIMVPLIVTSIICGVMHLGGDKNFGRLGGKTLLYYTISGALAVTIGLLVVNIIGPGRVDAETARNIVDIGQEQAAGDASFQSSFQRATEADTGVLARILERMIPANVFDAASDNRALLSIIFFSLLFGFFIAKLPEAQKQFQVQLWESLQTVVIRITNLVLAFAPIGVLGLTLPIFIQTDFGKLFAVLVAFFLTVLIALGVHFFISMGLLLKVIGKVRPQLHFKAMAPVLLTAFSTASSSATLPLTMKTVRDGAGVSERTSSFTLPLGATVNMDGTALYECVVVIFIAQLFGVIDGTTLGLGGQLLVVILALTTSIGVAGIPAASMTAIVLILGVVGLPAEAVGIVWITDRILDMCRTAVNVFSDTVGAVIIAKTEGESPYPEEAASEETTVSA